MFPASENQRHNQIMIKAISCAFALALTFGSASAAIPVTAPQRPIKANDFQARKGIKTETRHKAPAGSQNTWMEDFEGRPDSPAKSMQDWLPEGWQDISKKGNTPPTDNTRWNLTWQVTTNDFVSMHNPSGPACIRWQRFCLHNSRCGIRQSYRP